MAGEMISGNGQLEYRGILLGDDETTFMDSITGWDDLPGVDSGNTPRSNSHGAWVGRKLANQRVINWSGRFSPAKVSEWEESLKALRSALTLPTGTEEYPIVIQSIGEKKMCFGAVVNRSIPMDRSYGYYGAHLSVQFECSDPRRYSIFENVWNLELPPAVDVGLEYPLTYPLDYGVEVNSNTGTLVNDGDVVSPVSMTFYGPMVNPTIINQTTGAKLQFFINLSADESLEVDTRKGTVLLNGIADRLYTRAVNSSPLLSFGINPGANEMFLTADEWDSPASLTITWRNATL